MAFLTTSIFPNGCPVKVSYPPDTLYGANFYPIGFDLKSAMALAWRGYVYRMAGSISGAFVSSSVNSEQVYRIGFPVDYPSTMSPLLCSRGENNLFGFSENFGEWNFAIITDSTQFGKIYEYEGLYYPYLQIGYGGIADTSFRPEDPYGPVGKARIFIDEKIWEADLVGAGVVCNIDISIVTERSPN